MGRNIKTVSELKVGDRIFLFGDDTEGNNFQEDVNLMGKWRTIHEITHTDAFPVNFPIEILTTDGTKHRLKAHGIVEVQ